MTTKVKVEGLVPFSSSTGSFQLPSGTTGQRDGSPNFGQTRANTTISKVEWWNGVSWTPIGSGATGAGLDAAFIETDAFITTSYTIGSGALVTCTVSIATPGVVTLNSHGFVAGQPISFATTGALPTGLDAVNTFYVSSTGLTSNTFQVATTLGGSSLATSGTQSGVQTVGKVKNALSGGPVTIATGATITIPTGSTWVVA